MKLSLGSLACVLCIHSLNAINPQNLQQGAQQNQPVVAPAQTQKPKDNDEAVVIMGHMANMFVNAATFATNPQNPIPIAAAVGDLLQIIAQIVKNIPLERQKDICAQDIEDYLLTLDPHFRIKLRYLLLSCFPVREGSCADAVVP